MIHSRIDSLSMSRWRPHVLRGPKNLIDFAASQNRASQGKAARCAAAIPRAQAANTQPLVIQTAVSMIYEGICAMPEKFAFNSIRP